MFEWDPWKAARNLKKHEVSFEEATTVFADEHAVDVIDERHSGVERRFLKIGQSNVAAVLVIAYTLRRTGDGDEETIRIISARRANRKERATYVALDQAD